jgi:DnaJ-class molecular chaperone
VLQHGRLCCTAAVPQVNEFASSAEIKKGYMTQSLRYHPDKLSGASQAELAEAETNFHRAREAHEILSDMATRREYDRARDKLEAEGQAGLTDVRAA